MHAAGPRTYSKYRSAAAGPDVLRRWVRLVWLVVSPHAGEAVRLYFAHGGEGAEATEGMWILAV